MELGTLFAPKFIRIVDARLLLGQPCLASGFRFLEIGLMAFALTRPQSATLQSVDYGRLIAKRDPEYAAAYEFTEADLADA